MKRMHRVCTFPRTPPGRRERPRRARPVELTIDPGQCPVIDTARTGPDRPSLLEGRTGERRGAAANSAPSCRRTACSGLRTTLTTTIATAALAATLLTPAHGPRTVETAVVPASKCGGKAQGSQSGHRSGRRIGQSLPAAALTGRRPGGVGVHGKLWST